MRLSTRLVSGTALIAISSIAAVAIAARQGTRTAFVQFAHNESQHTQLLAASHRRLADAMGGRCCRQTEIDAALEVVSPGGGFVVLDPGDRLVAFAGPTFLGVSNVEANRRAAGLALTAERAGERFTVSIPAAGVPVQLEDGRTGTVHAVRLPGIEDLRRLKDFSGVVDRRLLTAVAGGGLLAVLLAWFAARKIAAPLGAISQAAAAVAAGDLSRRVAESRTDEIGQLARRFNAMAAALERQERLRDNLVRDVAHELRTPLTALRCRLESVIDEVVPEPRTALLELRDELMHLARLVGDLEQLSLAEAEQISLAVDDIPLLPVIVSALRGADLESDARVTMDVPEAVSVKADAVRLRQILLNLLTNARTYTPDHGVIHISARAELDNVVIEVRNTGSALTADEQAQVFERFYRTDPARQRSTGGAGLGLAIVKNLVRALGGRVWVSGGPSEVVFSVALRRL